MEVWADFPRTFPPLPHRARPAHPHAHHILPACVHLLYVLRTFLRCAFSLITNRRNARQRHRPRVWQEQKPPFYDPWAHTRVGLSCTMSSLSKNSVLSFGKMINNVFFHIEQRHKNPKLSGRRLFMGKNFPNKAREAISQSKPKKRVFARRDIAKEWVIDWQSTGK